MTWIMSIFPVIKLMKNRAYKIRRSKDRLIHRINKFLLFLVCRLPYYNCNLSINASCKTCEKLIPFDIASSLSHSGMLKVFLTAFEFVLFL